MAIRDILGAEGVLDATLGGGGAAGTIVVAQAEAPPAPPENQGGTAATMIVAIEDGNIARLPAGTDIASPRVNGTDLEFVQPDGTVVVIPNGAVQGLTLFIGDIEIPADTVAALFDANGIRTAAGPESGGGGQDGAHGSFVSPGDQSVGDGLGYSGLLGNDESAPGGGEETETPGENLAPVIVSAVGGRLSEEGFGIADGDGASDATNASTLTGTVVVSDIGPLSFSFGVPAGAFTSGGVAITWTASGGTLIGAAGATPVLVATIGSSGAYTVVLSAPLDHPVHGVEDEITLELPVTVTDSGGLSASTTIAIIVEDDSPLIGESETGQVDEAILAFGGDLPWDPRDEGPSSDWEPGSQRPDTASGSLAIDWGADNGDDETLTGDGNRSVVFTNADVTARGTFGEGLTSMGRSVSTAILSDGTLVGYTGEAIPPSAEGDNVVFFAKLDDDGAGSYEFTLVQPLDHADDEADEEADEEADAQNTLSLSFNYTATDADGDSASGRFTVNVEDDVPEVSEAGALSFAEDDVSPDAATDATETDVLTKTAALNIDWGVDDDVRGTGDGYGRTLAFILADGVPTDTEGNPLALTSDGVALSYAVTALDNGGEQLVAFKGTDTAENRVFIVTLDPTAAGGAYTFTLAGNLDHAGDEANAEDRLSLSFGYTATDADGDADSESFRVTVVDDVPVSTGEVQNAGVYETELPNGSAPDSGSDLNDDDGGGDRNYTGNLTGLVAFGADGKGAYVVETTNLAPELGALTSGGVSLSYSIGADNMLIAKAGSAVIFTFQVDPRTGQYTFALQGPLDHLDAGGQPNGALVLDMSSAVSARDGDGDGDTLALGGQIFITVNDDVPALDTPNVVQTGTQSLQGVSRVGDIPRDRYVSAAPDGLEGIYNIYKITFATPFAGVPVVSLPATGSNATDRFDLSARNITATGFEVWVYRTDGNNDGRDYGDAVGSFSYTASYGDAIGRIDEEGLNPTDSNTDNAERGDLLGDATIVSGSLDIAWGADDANANVDGGIAVGGAVSGDRALTFADDAIATLTALGLTSDGVALSYALSANGTLLTASADGRTVFTVALSDAAAGGYTFTLLDNLDHPAGDAENDRTLTFRFTATDADKDATGGSFAVVVNDDSPVSTQIADPAPTMIEEPGGGETTATIATLGQANSARATFGDSGANYYGQTFVAGDSYLKTLTFELNPFSGRGYDATDFRLLIVEIDDAGNPRPTNILFESETLSAPQTGSTRFTVDINVALTKDTTYAWVLDAYTDRDGQLGLSSVDATGDGYAGGHFFYLGGGDRDAAFAADWGDHKESDLAFDMEFSAGPPTSSATASIDLGPLVAFGADGPHGTDAFQLASVSKAAFAGVATEGGAPVLLTNVGGVLIGHTEGNADDPVFKLEIADGKAVLTLYEGLGGDPAVLDFSAYIRAIDGDGDAITLDTGKVVFSVAAVNDAPVITGRATGSVVETGDIADIDEAGPGGAFEPRIAPNGTIDTALNGLLTSPSGVPGALTAIAGVLGGNTAQAVAVIWDYLDDKYTSAGPNQGNVNEAFVRLGVEYAEYLLAGGSPLTDVVAKYAPDSDNDGYPQRLQNLHDNLLGNLNATPLNSRFGSNATLYDELTALVKGIDPNVDFTTRPIYSGNEEGADSDPAPAEDWDLANGLVPMATGQLTVTDADQVSGHVWTPGSFDGTYGRFTLDQTGKWTYTLDNGRPETQALPQGQTVTDSFTVTVTDGQGATDTQTVTITVTGANDAPVITGTSSATVQEDVGVVDGTLCAGGTLTIADADAGESSFRPQAGTAGTYGTFTLNADGTWTYTADNGQAAIQGLAIDEVLTDSFTALSADGTATQVVTVTIKGSNDVVYTVNDTVDPSATKAEAGTEIIVGSGIPASNFGLVNQTDVGVELGLQVIYRQGPTVSSSDDYSDGVLHFWVNDGPQSTANGSSADNDGRAAWSFQYSIATGLDGNPGDLDDFTFKLLYDVDPTAAVDYVTLVLEPGGSGSSGYQWRVEDSPSDLANGQVLIADDGGNASVTQNSENYAFTFFQSFLGGVYGPLDNFDGPAQFDVVLEAYRGDALLAGNHIAVDVIETNDAPIITGDTTGIVRERGGTANAQSGEGNPLVSNLARGNLDAANGGGDLWQVVSIYQNSANNYGWYTVDAAGNWSFLLNDTLPVIEALKENQATLTDSFTVYTQNGTAQVVNITIQGNNDAPIVQSALVDQTSVEGQPFRFTIPADTFSDVDGRFDGTSDPLTLTATLSDFNPLPGWLSFDDTTGTFSGTPPDNFTGALEVRVTAYDGEQFVRDDFTLTITPANDAPVVGGEPIGIGRGYPVNGANSLYASASIDLDYQFPTMFTDPENDALTWSASLPSANWSFDPSSRVLTFDSTVPTGIYDITVTATDGTTAVSQVVKVWVAGSTSSWIDDNGGTGNDTIIGVSPSDMLNGNNDNDFVDGGGGADIINGNNGNDVLYGSTGTDTLRGGNDDDYINGGSDGDELFGGNGDDWIVGEDGNDKLSGDAGNDTLLGGNGNDILTGGDGNDILIGGAGSDTMTGGSGSDTFVISADTLGGTIDDFIADYSAGDIVDLSDVFATFAANDPDTAGEADSAVQLVTSGGNTLVQVDNNGEASGGTFVTVASLTGIHDSITILYDDASGTTVVG